MTTDGYNIARASQLQSRSISAENPSGEAGAGGRAVTGTGANPARNLGPGWKVSPSLQLPAESTITLADISGSGVLQHFWISILPEWWRSLIIRFYWDDSAEASVEMPLGDLFALGWDTYAPLNSTYVVSAPYCALNLYWPMPFRTAARVTLENPSAHDAIIYYYLDYGLGEVADDALYFHGTWRRTRAVVDGLHELVNVKGAGKYVGTYMALGTAQPGWWGEGELKFYINDDTEFPTICGTGTEDYFGGACCYEVPKVGYTEFSSPLLGLHQVIRPDGLYRSQQRFGMYRWHELDAVNFTEGLRVEVQDLGWIREDEYLVRTDDIATSAFWYSDRPRASGSGSLTLSQRLVSSHPRGTVHPAWRD